MKKILYAVQATGNGHITRARLMAEVFKKLGLTVDWVFTGRAKDELFDMEPFGDFRCFQGLTFNIRQGRIAYVATAVNNNIFRFIRDILDFSFDGYDLVINDFEPVTAWAAKRQGIKTIGLSHQMAFHKTIPVAGRNWLAEKILKNFAPVDMPIGLHWSDFNQSMLPPIIDNRAGVASRNLNKVLVYFPFCDVNKLINWFAPFENIEFHIFHGTNRSSDYSNIHLHHFSRHHFQRKQQECGSIITGAGFELPSEAIQMGHKLMVLPLAGQMEQQSNALALAQIDRAMVVNQFNHEELKLWLQKAQPNPKKYPDVALELAKWLVSRKKESLESLSKRLWAEFHLNEYDKSTQVA
ncbi:glycosyltransferase family protein [Aliikangiella sp. G2MR2-5]|uniref:glycosyltransferase family protein n=1 Tax=Aliikangiella sp. G2MR2-5 TaxID=2788943 RepID=UPI0018AB080E|nr:glycosyltransferase family protein [Aliikangiella sp. G2MR2-5]